MEKTLKKMVKTGYGVGLLSLDQARKVAGKVKKELNLNEAESRRLAKELVATSGRASKDVLKAVDKHFSSALVKSGAVKKSELKTVKKMVGRNVQGVKRRVRSVGKKVTKGAAGKKSVVKRVKRKVKKAVRRKR